MILGIPSALTPGTFIPSPGIVTEITYMWSWPMRLCFCSRAHKNFDIQGLNLARIADILWFAQLILSTSIQLCVRHMSSLGEKQELQLTIFIRNGDFQMVSSLIKCWTKYWIFCTEIYLVILKYHILIKRIAFECWKQTWKLWDLTVN